MTRALYRAALAAGLVALSVHAPALKLGAQQNPPPQRAPVFRGESVLVTVDAYPQRDGRIVEGLTAADFQVLEDGKAQTVETVEFVRVEPSLSESLRRDPNSTNEMRALVADPHTRVFVVFLDKAHVTISGADASRRPLIDTLDRLIGLNDLFAMMTHDTDPRLLTFGRRLQSIDEELARHWAWGERQRIGTDAADPVEEQLKTCFEFKPDRDMTPWMVDDNGQQRFLYELLIDRRREDRTFTALERLVDRLAGMREARTVTLLITEGWRLFADDRRLAEEVRIYGASMPVPGSIGRTVGTGSMGTTDRGFGKRCNDELIRLASINDPQRLKDLITRANRANVSFYPVNPAGLQTFDTSINQRTQPSMLEDSNRLKTRLDAMRTLADNTDGLAIVNTNDLGAGMKRIVDDVSAYYLLGYYSTNTAHDGRFRRIDVKMKQPNVNMRARRGYFAPTDTPVRGTIAAPPAGPAPPVGLADALGELSKLQSDAQVFVRGGIAGDRIQVAVELASSRSALAPWTNGADVRISATGAGGAAIPAATVRMEANTRGVLMSIPAVGTTTALRIVAKVSAGGETLEGTADIGGTAAGLVGEAVLYRGRPAATAPLRPVADLTFWKTERVHVEWALMGDIDERSARLLGRTGQPLAVPVTVTERETEGRRVVAADLNLAPLSAGQYVIELTVGRGATKEQRLIAFRVVQ